MSHEEFNFNDNLADDPESERFGKELCDFRILEDVDDTTTIYECSRCQRQTRIRGDFMPPNKVCSKQ